ncbi:SDR family oxidoreductase [Polyangium mundeleinium]|uniref:NAD(P)H-binding protein n=1 Tax=Polyangium mundeleinium TaxID=2995306 RepID=A0ABT5F204_9BACT|nr:NAD(P)H-binding protein [Polyangium mundeleinium]MDC0748130.1 NAD(P)H-binding protein [Polyangium mundeleinium]
MSPPRVLLAGATGAVGSEVLRLLRERGHFVRTFSRNAKNAEKIRPLASEVVLGDATRADSLNEALAGINVVVSCLGANVALGTAERRSFRDVDLVAHENLLAAARRASATRFVYLSAHPGPGYDHTRYMRAHLDTEDMLRASGLSCTFVRPTGIYSALGDLIDMARWGVGSVAGDGTAKANPVHPVCVAEVMASVTEDGPEIVTVGGPEIMTREEIMRLAFEVVGKEPRIMHVPPGVFRFGSAMLRLLHPRLSDMLEFVAAVTTSDSVAEARGTRPLRPWFEALARQ